MQRIRDRVGSFLARLALGSRKADPGMGLDADQIRAALDGQVRAAAGKVPGEVMAKMLRIRQVIDGVLPHLGSFPLGSQDLFIVERTATNYLPAALEAYLRLPKGSVSSRPVQDGKTATQLLLEQLTLLENKMREVAVDVQRNDADHLLANGRFLEERFGGSEVSFKPPTPGKDA